MNGIDEYIASMDRKVRKYGWGVVFVGEGDHEPPFAYTVGLPRQYGHPEFVVVGVSPEAAGTLNDIAGRVRDGQVFCPGDRPDRLLQDYTTELIGLDWEQSHRNLPVAWRINSGPVDALQLVWPDERNRLPWEVGYCLPPDVQPLWGGRPEDGIASP